MTQSLKNRTDTEILEEVRQAMKQIRESPNQFGVIRITISGGKVKFLTVEKPVASETADSVM